MENTSWDGLSPDWYSNPTPPKFEVRVLTTISVRSLFTTPKIFQIKILLVNSNEVYMLNLCAVLRRVIRDKVYTSRLEYHVKQ
jgi:hypothetical protein